jgi:enoyl-CoA hydratase/carnithine racemase
VSDALRVVRDGAVTRLILNRPEKANALNAVLVEALLAAVDAAFGDGTRLLIFEGEGSLFSAGFDFGGLADASDAALARRFMRVETLLQKVYHAPIATLALAHGRVFGAAADLVAVCHRRVADPETTFRMPGLRFGIVLGTRRLANLIGADAARAILSESRAFDAAEAARLGFVTEVVPKADWPKAVAAATQAAQVLDPVASAELFSATVVDTRAEDMAAIERSVLRPGLKARIETYLAAMKKAPKS